MKPHFGTPFEELAKFFHQDYHLLFTEFSEGLRMYWENLDPKGKDLLKSAIIQKLRSHSNSSEFRQAWEDAGAQWVPSRIDIRSEFQKFIDNLT